MPGFGPCTLDSPFLEEEHRVGQDSRDVHASNTSLPPASDSSVPEILDSRLRELYCAEPCSPGRISCWNASQQPKRTHLHGRSSRSAVLDRSKMTQIAPTRIRGTVHGFRGHRPTRSTNLVEHLSSSGLALLNGPDTLRMIASKTAMPRSTLKDSIASLAPPDCRLPKELSSPLSPHLLPHAPRRSRQHSGCSPSVSQSQWNLGRRRNRGKPCSRRHLRAKFSACQGARSVALAREYWAGFLVGPTGSDEHSVFFALGRTASES